MSPPRWSLRFAWGRAPYALDLPEVVIGRGDTCSLQIDEAAAGDEHARVIVDEQEGVWLEDLGTGNPTLVNGKAIRGRARLSDGDFIQIGHSVLTLRALERELPTAGPEAPTLGPRALPEEARRVLAQREAKNFVVGVEKPGPLATVMMESPLAPRPAQGDEETVVARSARDPQRTVEADAGEVLASMRAAAASGADASVTGMPTLIGEAKLGPRTLVGDASVTDMPTLIGEAATTGMPTLVGDAPRATAPMSADGTLTSAVTVLGEGLPRSRGDGPTMPAGGRATAQMPTMLGVGAMPLPDQPTQLGTIPGPPLPTSKSGPVKAVAPSSPPSAAPAAGFDAGLATRIDPLDMVNAPTMIGESPAAPGRSADVTPLPAPLPPPTSSIPDLRPFVPADAFDDQTVDRTRPDKRNTLPPGPGVAPRAAEASNVEEPELPTQTAQRPMPSPEARLSSRKTMPPVAQQEPQPQPPTTSQSTATLPYVEPKKGSFGSFSRAIDFFQQMLALGRREPALRKPMFTDLAIATVVSLLLSLLMLVMHSPNAANLVMLVGITTLYFIDYACNALTASLLHDYVTTGKIDAAHARTRVRRSLRGIITFAAISAVLDMATTYARERRDPLSKILLSILRAIWSTATYVIMPAMIIEGVSFGDAFARSKKLMDRDPTSVGAGVVALSLSSYLCAAIFFPLAFFLERIGMHVHPVLGMVLFFMTVNAYWAVSGWMKISYATCFYLWARSCEAEGRADPSLAPLPLRHAIAAG